MKRIALLVVLLCATACRISSGDDDRCVRDGAGPNRACCAAASRTSGWCRPCNVGFREGRVVACHACWNEPNGGLPCAAHPRTPGRHP